MDSISIATAVAAEEARNTSPEYWPGFSSVGQMQPGQAFLRKYVPCRPKLAGVAKGADVEMGFG